MTVNNDGHPLTGWPFVVVSPFPPPCVIPGQRPPAGTERAARALTSRREPQMRLAGTIIHLFIFITIQTMATQQSEAPVAPESQDVLLALNKQNKEYGYVTELGTTIGSVCSAFRPIRDWVSFSSSSAVSTAIPPVSGSTFSAFPWIWRTVFFRRS